MKQLWQSITTGEATVVDVPTPRVGRGQILVRVMASLISSGTERSVVEFASKNLIQKAISRPDLVKQLTEKASREGWLTAIEGARRRLDSEMILGYSNAGVVLDVGDNAGSFQVGDRVACAGGGFATHSEIVRIPRNLAAVVPAGPSLREVPFDEMAFATVAAVALQGIRLAELELGEVIAVIGLGLLGQIAVQLARANGCMVIGMDPSEHRCRMAEQMGAFATASSEEQFTALAARVTGGRGVDSIVITAATESNGPVNLAAEIARDRARVIAVGAVGLSLTRKPYYMKELDFRVSRSYGPGRYDSQYEENGHDYPIGYVRWTEGRNLTAILQMLAAGQLDFAPLISHRFPIEEADKAYELLVGQVAAPVMGVLIIYPNEPSTARRIELPASPQANAAASSTIRLGLIGAGSFTAATLLPAMKSVANLEFVGVCTSSGSGARSAGQRYGFRYCASDPAELLQDASINTIAICTRHSSHAGQVVAALEAGKHVFCEKPLAMNEDQLAAIVGARDRQDPQRLLLVGYNRRFAPLAKEMKAFLAGSSEPFVMHYRVNAGFIPADHWTQDSEQGGGRILGEVCHFVDFLSFVCNHPVTSVFVRMMPNVGRYCDDNLVASLRFSDGSIGSILYTANGDKSFSKERVEVFAGGQIAVLDDYRVLQTIKNGKKRVVRNRLRIDKGHRGEWEAFGESIGNGKASPISLSEIANSTLAAVAMVRAAAEGRSIDIDSESFMARVRAGSPSVERGQV